jgi:hypothetical protein
MKKAFSLCMSLSMIAFAADYFPLGKGNIWNYSYESRSTIVYPNAPTTNESGSVTWEALTGLGNSVFMLYYIKETRSCTRRTSFNDTQTFYDSVFSPPRVTLDTIVFRQGVVLIDTGRIADSTKNAISFSGADCPVAVHNPQKPLPVELGIEDTAVQFNGSNLACKKTIPSGCSCYENLNAWSFILADTIGPVEVSITRCPGLAGTGYLEKRQLLSREYPTAVGHNSVAISRINRTTIVFNSGRINIALPLCRSSKVSATLYSASGRKIRQYSGRTAGTVSWSIGPVPQGIYLVRIKTETGSVSKKIYVH